MLSVSALPRKPFAQFRGIPLSGLHIASQQLAQSGSRNDNATTWVALSIG